MLYARIFSWNPFVNYGGTWKIDWSFWAFAELPNVHVENFSHITRNLKQNLEKTKSRKNKISKKKTKSRKLKISKTQNLEKLKISKRQNLEKLKISKKQNLENSKSQKTQNLEKSKITKIWKIRNYIFVALFWRVFLNFNSFKLIC
jgi:hypothetical protein